MGEPFRVPQTQAVVHRDGLLAESISVGVVK